MSAARQLYAPRPAAVRVDDRGRPKALAGAAVETIREDWWVEDRWWTGRPLRRHYYELILANGRSATVFCDVRTGRWHGQRA
jgi:hypothetical protein